MSGNKDWSKERGVATEAHWDQFIRTIGGQRVTDLISKPKFDNADYLFPDDKVVIELKVLETEFARQPELQKKIESQFSDMASSNQTEDALLSKLIELIRHPLARVAKKANRQVRETKLHMGLSGWSGLLVCINDGFRDFSPQVVEGLFGRILNGSCSSIKGMVYMTNHYIELPGNPYALELWSPRYREPINQDLVVFVNKLGIDSQNYTETILGPYDWRGDGRNFDITNARIVTGPIRHYQKVDPIFLIKK